MNRKSIAIFTLIIVLFLITAVISTLLFPNQSDPLPYSVFSTEPDGSRAFFLLATHFGIDAKPLQTRVSDSLSGSLAIIHPGYTAKSDSEWEAILAWVYSGNNLIVFDDYIRLSIRLNSLNLPAPMPAMGKWGLYGIFYESAYGEGSIRFVPDSTAITNSYITAQNARYLLSCFWELRDEPVYFDEHERSASLFYYQNSLSSDDEAPSSPSLLMPEPLRAALLQLALAVMLIMLFYRQRVGRADIYRLGNLRRDNEDVFALAGLMRKDRLIEDSVIICFNNFIRLLTGSSEYDPYKLESVWSSSGYPELKSLINLTREIDVVRAGHRLSNRDSIRIIREIDRLSLIIRSNAKDESLSVPPNISPEN